MNKKRTTMIRILWAILFLLNLGASIALNLLPIEPERRPVDLGSEPGWRGITWNSGGTYFYNDQVGLVRAISGQPKEDSTAGLFGEYPEWLWFQLALAIAGLVLVLGRRPRPIGLRHRLNLAFGFLILAWGNVAIFAVRLKQTASKVVPAGYEFIAPPSEWTGEAPDSSSDDQT
jgi:hypothetical protein